MAGKTAPVDKAQLQVMTKIDKAMKDIDEALKGFGTDSEKAEQAKPVKALQAKIDAAQQAGGPAAVKTLTQLLKTAEALAPAIRQRSYDLFASRRRTELKGQVNGALAGALLDVGKIGDPVLAKMMFAEQSKMKARMDKAEKMRNDLEAVDTMDDIDDEMPELQKRLKAALGVSAWLNAAYKPMLSLVEAAIKAMPDERARRDLRAEMDFVEVAKNGALAKLDIKAIEAATVPALRRILASTRNAATAPAH
jgi:hypothetical protein